MSGDRVIVNVKHENNMRIVSIRIRCNGVLVFEETKILPGNEEITLEWKRQ